jgi:hypothetical protein
MHAARRGRNACLYHVRRGGSRSFVPARCPLRIAARGAAVISSAGFPWYPYPMASMRPLLIVLALTAVGCAGNVSGSPDDGAVDAAATDASPGDGPLADAAPPLEGDAPGRAVAWTASRANVANPERGFYRYVDLATDRDFAFVRAGNDSLIYSYVRLDAFRDRAIDEALLTRVRAGLTAARAAGVKVVLRFAYNEGPYPDSEPDAPLVRVLAHIEQVAPVLRDNSDVIAVLQAGFIGAWGEWHTSTNGLDRDPAARLAALDALLAAMPADRSVLLRYPLYKHAIHGEPLDEASAWQATAEARTGHHNDCFVSSESDVGTYPDDEIDRWRDYVAADTRYVPFGCETCAVFAPRSACAPATAEMARMHMSFLNRDFETAIIDGWRQDGCLGDVERRLGYRLVLVDGELPAEVRPGGSFRLRVRIANQGHAAPFNPRSAWIVVDGGGQRHELEVPGSDLRRWSAGATHTIDLRLRLPATLPEGTHRVSLWLPDRAAGLRARSAYAVRVVNEGTWDDASGLNRLGEILVSTSAPGTTDPAADRLATVP